MSRATLWTKRILTLALLTSGICLSLVAAGALVTRYDLTQFRLGLDLFRAGGFLTLPALALLALAMGMGMVTGLRAKTWLTLALISALSASVYTASQVFKRTAAQVPRIHDITTDTEDPPRFEAVLKVREDALNPPEYPGADVATQQKQAYPDIQPVILNKAPREAYTTALEAAIALGWKIVDVNPSAGRFEATDTTLFFGYKDDVVVRVNPLNEAQSRVDVRSKSRVGVSDVGANAARIRKFLAILAPSDKGVGNP